MAWDKMEERPVGPVRMSLGIVFNTRNLTVGIEDHKVQKLLDLIKSTWNRNRKMFTVQEAAALVGLVISDAWVCMWIK